MIIPTTSTTNFVTNAGVIEFPAAVSHPHMALQVGGEVLVPDLVRDFTQIHLHPSGPFHWIIYMPFVDGA